uniref:Uncharacterized protein n=1 Tax=Norrisiella sphaerica TaxID=552664 RepID=A0A7S2VVR2_9EUKA
MIIIIFSWDITVTSETGRRGERVPGKSARVFALPVLNRTHSLHKTWKAVLPVLAMFAFFFATQLQKRAVFEMTLRNILFCVMFLVWGSFILFFSRRIPPICR